jgi:hypothetical protein
MKNPSLKSLKKTLTDCARDPRAIPYNVVAETGTADYLLDNSIIQLRGNHARPTPDVIRSVICDLALALIKIDEGDFAGS